MASASPEHPLGLVHLVREVNGEAPLRRFLESYRSHPAGVDHDLVLLLKGFRDQAAIDRQLELAGGPQWLAVPDDGYDLGAYMSAARRLPHERLCFVNSFSEVRTDRWLARLARPLDDGAGLVGATGSWASQLSYLRFTFGLGGPYAGVLGERGRVAELLRRLEPAGAGARTLRRVLLAVRDTLRRCVSFEPFPAHHVRTNAFCLERAVMLRVRPGRQRDKVDAYRLESGRGSLTRQVEAMGLGAVLADAAGRVYPPPEWPRSRTFWQAGQENALVADNQTRAYDRADPELRAVLARFAWGDAAEPAPAAAASR